ncbi:MAG: hypothetical protein C5B49_08825 [Bdellovibrio sp.]|nr:MAG: hypothetical protein C5B49_08825 [Bdellovibrio sp.]
MLSLGVVLCQAASATPAESTLNESQQTRVIAPGISIGTTGALSLKYFFSKDDSVDAAVEYRDHPWAVIYADYYRYFRGLFGQKSRFGREVSPYLGAGTGAGFWDRDDQCGRWKCAWTPGTQGTGNGFFVRLVGGLEWFAPNKAYTFYFEASPSWMWYPSSGQTVDVVIGAKYYFDVSTNR